MEAKIFQEIPVEEREAYLEANSDSTEEMPVKKHYEESEILEMRRQHVNNALLMRKLTQDFVKVKAEYDGKMKPLKEENAYTLNLIQTGYVEVNQQVYLVADFTTMMMGYYDKDGELLESRKLLDRKSVV